MRPLASIENFFILPPPVPFFFASWIFEFFSNFPFCAQARVAHIYGPANSPADDYISMNALSDSIGADREMDFFFAPFFYWLPLRGDSIKFYSDFLCRWREYRMCKRALNLIFFSIASIDTFCRGKNLLSIDFSY